MPPCWQPHSHTQCWQQSHPLPGSADKGRAGKSHQGLEGKPGVTPWPLAGKETERMWEEDEGRRTWEEGTL